MHFADAFIQSDLQCIQAIHFVSMPVPWELSPQPFALLTQCYTSEPQEHTRPGSSWGFNNKKYKWGLSRGIKRWRERPARDSNSQPFDYKSDSLPLGHDFPMCVTLYRYQYLNEGKNTNKKYIFKKKL